MGTRSFIGITDGKSVRAIYCHWDGYLSHNGVILALGYEDVTKIRQLINSGGKSSIGYNIEAPRKSPNKDDLDYLHLFSNAHVLTSFCTNLTDDPTETYSLEQYNSELASYVYLFDLRDTVWYLLRRDKKKNEKKYVLNRLFRDKEYYQNYLRETGDYENWLSVRTAFSGYLKELNGEISIVSAYNKELKSLMGENTIYKFGRQKDVYVLYKKGAKEPVWWGYIMADALIMLKRKKDSKKK